jgi:subtilisin family serine protease
MIRRPILASVTAASVVLSTAMLASPATAASPPDDPGHSKYTQADPALRAFAGKDARKLTSFRDASGQVTAFVQLASPSGVQVDKKAGTDAADIKDAAKDTQALAVDVVPQKLSKSNASSSAPKRIGTLTNLVSATLVTGDADQIRALASNPDVVAIYQVARKKLTNASTVAFTQALKTWQETGNTGAGVRIGIIDTGLDYTHADFGGPGTVAAYQAAYGTNGTQAIPAGYVGNGKFLGGYDFAGPLYDADPDSTLPGHTPVPTADANPIDSLSTSDNVGHGTHVAGTAAGYGVDASSDTFDGDYAALTSLDGWKIGPGSAPEAGLYALKVFGDIGGSTDLTGLALDRAMDPNGDGNFSDRLDVVNLSLGSDATPADDPDTILIDQLSAAGTVVAISSGNGGDITDIGGSPGNAASALTVANSVGGPQTYDAVEVSAPAALVGTYTGQNSIAYTGTTNVTGAVAFVGDRFDGCAPFTSAQAAAVNGKIAYLWWDDDDSTRVCGSVARFTNAKNAGAIGVLLPTTNTVFSAGISGIAAIPGTQLTRPATVALLPAIKAGTLVVEIGPENAGDVTVDLASDAINPSSSRGVHGSLGISKPDVAAPGTGIFSAASGTGNEPQSLTGTSMAAPHVAGIAALVVKAHPTWTSAQVKAAVINTATHDVYTGPGHTGVKYGPQRVGSGRVDAFNAVSTKVIAYNKANPALTSVTFGVVPVGASTVVKKQVVTVKNFGYTAQVLNTSVTLATKAGGATITASPATVTVPGNGTAEVTLTLTAAPSTLKREIDPTSAVKQAGVAREYVAEVAGRLVLSSVATGELRLPVQAAPKLVSDLHASSPVFASGSTEAALPITGRGVTTGGFNSLTSPLILARTDPKETVAPARRTSRSALGSGDFKYVGWSSTVPEVQHLGREGALAYGQLNIGIATYGQWATLGWTVTPEIDIDVDRDGDIDLVTVVTKLNADTDLTTVETYTVPDFDLVGLEYVNNEPGDIDTGVFDNSVLVAPINLDDVGIVAGDKPMVYVSTWSDSYGDDADGFVDDVAPFVVDPFTPPLWFETNFNLSSSATTGKTSIPVHRTASTKSGKVLLLNHQNADPTSRAQVVSIKTASSTKLALSPTTARFGSAVKATAVVTGSVAPTGKVEFRQGAKVLARANLAITGTTGKATVTLPKSLKVGKHPLTAVYLGSSVVASSHGKATLTIIKAKPKVSLSAVSWTVKKNSTPKIAITVKGSSGAPAPTGKVTVKVGSSSIKATLTNGKVTVRLPKVTRTVVVTATYSGSTQYLPAIGSHKLTVK